MNTEWQDFAARAFKVYEQTLKSQLEPLQDGKLIAVEPASGRYVLAESLAELDAAVKATFGQKPVHVFRVGGGAAIKIGARYAGIS